MQKILLVLISIALISGSVTYLNAQQSDLNQQEDWISPNPPPAWVNGGFRFEENQIYGVSLPSKTIQEAFLNAYIDAIYKISLKYGTNVGNERLNMELSRYAVKQQVYDPKILKELEKLKNPKFRANKNEFKYSVQNVHIIEPCIEYRKGFYTVHVLVDYDADKIKSELSYANRIYSRLPQRNKGFMNQSLWQLMYSLLVTAESSEDKFWEQKRKLSIQKTDSDIDDLIQSDIGKTKLFDISRDDYVTEANLDVKYEPKLAIAKLTLKVWRRDNNTYVWSDTATGFMNRSKRGAFLFSIIPTGGQYYMHNRQWMTLPQFGLGIGWLVSSIWYNDKHEDYKNLRGVTRDELNSDYKKTKNPQRLRVGFGTAFGGLWLLNTILAVYDAYQHQELQKSSEIDNPILSLETMPNEIRLDQKF